MLDEVEEDTPLDVLEDEPPVLVLEDEPPVDDVLDTLPLEEGYWRIARNSTDVRRCPDAAMATTGCVGGMGASPMAGSNGGSPGILTPQQMSKPPVNKADIMGMFK